MNLMHRAAFLCIFLPSSPHSYCSHALNLARSNGRRRFLSSRAPVIPILQYRSGALCNHGETRFASPFLEDATFFSRRKWQGVADLPACYITTVEESEPCRQLGPFNGYGVVSAPSSPITLDLHVGEAWSSPGAFGSRILSLMPIEQRTTVAGHNTANNRARGASASVPETTRIPQSQT